MTIKDIEKATSSRTCDVVRFKNPDYKIGNTLYSASSDINIATHLRIEAMKIQKNKTKKRGPYNKAFNRRCFICGGAVVDSGDSWQCLNPECEAEFKEV